MEQMLGRGNRQGAAAEGALIHVNENPVDVISTLQGETASLSDECGQTLKRIYECGDKLTSDELIEVAEMLKDDKWKTMSVS